MALFKCPECGRDISTAAQSCPSCGYPIARTPERKTSKGLLALLGCLVAVPVILMGVAMIGILAAIAIPSFVKARETSRRNACLNNLAIIDETKAAWAKQHNATNGFLIPEEQFEQLLAQQHPVPITCPVDAESSFATSYEVNPVGFLPVCLCDDSHELADDDVPGAGVPGALPVAGN